MDIFENREARAMLIAKQMDPFDSDDYIYELKFDGIRTLAYLDKNMTDLRNKRNKELLHLFPELMHLNESVSQKCILDGELIVIKNGKPDFYEIQKRTMLTNLFKIEMNAKKYHASYIVYDILYFDNHLLIDEPIEKRKEILNQIVKENELIALSRVIESKGIELFNVVKQQNLEGVVAKRKGSLYFFGKRSQDWIKFKYLEDNDYVICGYILKSHHMTSFILGQYLQDRTLVYKGHCTLGCSINILKQNKYTVIEHSPFYDTPNGNEDAIWLKPELVCIVEYMPSDKEGLRQPVFKGIRDDKKPYDCVVKTQYEL